MTVAIQLAEFAAGMKASDIPGPATEMAKSCLLDLLAAAVAGHSSDTATANRKLAFELSAAGPATVWFSAESRTALAAALANSGAACALDVDDGHRRAGGHPGASIIPAALATAEETGATGQDLLASIVIGYEIAIRVAAAREISKLETFATGRWCAYGAAAAAAWLKRLDAPRLAEALAIAGAQAPDLTAAGYTSRRGHGVKEGIPWSTLTGLAAVRLAEEGVTGPTDLLDHAGYFDGRTLVGGLGGRYAIQDVYFKPYGCCRWLHAAVDALLGLQSDHALQATQIRKVRAYTVKRVLRLSNSPAPWSLEAAQYSLPFCLAVVACEGPDALLALSRDLLARRDLRAFGEKVEIEADPRLDAMFPALAPARVSIDTDLGTFEREVLHALGDPERPMGAADVEAKFSRLVRRYWPTRTQRQVIQTVETLEAGGASRLMEILAQPLVVED